MRITKLLILVAVVLLGTSLTFAQAAPAAKKPGTAATTTEKPATEKSAQKPATEPLDINTATKGQLEALPGMRWLGASAQMGTPQGV